MLIFLRSIKFIVYILFSLPLKYCGSDINNDFIAEYFLLKNVSSVIGYICSEGENSDYLQLVKKLHGINIKTAFFNKRSEVKVPFMSHSIFWQVGVILDTRCVSFDDVRLVFMKVSRVKIN